jgi:1,4-dihydroxy-2-naphthoate octaprenyltransferase
VRVTAGGLVPPQRVLVATYVTFALVVLVGMYLVYVAGPELLLVGAASILAGVLYTGGPRPYGYEGLGEVFVFTFFGIVAVTGTYYVQVERLPWEAFVLAVPGRAARLGDPGGQQRPRPRDRPPGGQAHARRAHGPREDAGAVRGDARGRVPDAGARWRWRSARGSCSPCSPPRWRSSSSAPCAPTPTGPTLNGVLAQTGVLQLVFCVLLSVGILIS